MVIPSLVGYTSSKKLIYQYDTSNPEDLSHKISDFSDEDHSDSIAVFSYLEFVYWRKYGEDSLDLKSATNMLLCHNRLVPAEFFKTHAKKLGLITAIDLAKYGRCLCLPYLQKILDI